MRCGDFGSVRKLFVGVAMMAAPAFVDAQVASRNEEVSFRTAWGDPDLQGIWNNSTLTPFQRPQELENREFLSDEEIAELEERTADRNDRLWREPARRTETGGNVGAYNNFWMERGTTVVPTRRTSIIVDPIDGRLPPLILEAHDRMTSIDARTLADIRRGNLPADSWEQLDLGDRCIWYRGIPSFPTGYNNNYHIVQNATFVAILQEHIHDVRFVPLDGRPHVPSAIRQYAGDSRGYWEGDTLVVETTNFNEKAFIRNFSGELSDSLHVVERFTLTDFGVLDYEFTVTDPNTWTRPWSGSLPHTRVEGPMFEYACHEGNYGLRNILSGSRMQDINVGEIETVNER